MARAKIAPGIYPGLSNDAYHASPGISKSGLWTIHTQTPAHYRFPPPPKTGTQAEAAKDQGQAIHIAVLEPNTFENRVMQGPPDRRGNAWKDFQAEATNTKRILLTQGMYESTLALRDALHDNARLNAIVTGGKPEIEHSGYWTDPATGELCRCRPDLYRADLNLILDLKSTVSAHPDDFRRSVIRYGYHSQEAFYTDGYDALGRKDTAFVFLAFEKEEPFAFGLYELPPSIVDEGREIMRSAMKTYSACRKANRWPAYGEDVQELSFKHWDYQLTDAPEREPEAEAA